MDTLRERVEKEITSLRAGSRWHQAGVIIFFLLLPQAVASVVTGFSAVEAWRSRKLTKIWQPLLVWIAAYVWLVVFWFWLVPAFIIFLVV